MSTLSIRPINTGFMIIPKSAFLHDSVYPYFDFPDIQRGTPVFSFLVEGGDKPLLFDTGMSNTERAHKYHYLTAEQPEGMSIVDQLKTLGYEPEDIGYVVLSHLHWDHCYYMDRFTNARFFVHPTEIAFAQDPVPVFYKAYEHPVTGLTSPFSGLKLEPVTEGMEIIPGVSVLESPGHSPGHISICIDTASGEYICAGDSIMTLLNLVSVEPLHYAISPPGRAMNLVTAFKSIEIQKARAKSPDFLLFCHSTELLERVKETPVLR